MFPTGSPARAAAISLGALTATAALVVAPLLPSIAQAVVVGSRPVTQSLTTSAFGVPPAVHRDGFAVTQRTLVQWPVPATTTLSSEFGYRSCAGCSSNHLGIDLNPGDGYPVQAIADGTVVIAEESDAGLGVLVVIEHVVNGVTVRSLYGHLRFGSIAVAVGQQVARGQVIGAVGNTGASTGPHLHFGILIDGTEVDPHAWLLASANV